MAKPRRKEWLDGTFKQLTREEEKIVDLKTWGKTPKDATPPNQWYGCSCCGWIFFTPRKNWEEDLRPHIIGFKPAKRQMKKYLNAIKEPANKKVTLVGKIYIKCPRCGNVFWLDVIYMKYKSIFKIW